MTVKKGFINGLYMDFYSNGKLKLMGNYINGLNRDGIWKWWYEDGQIRSIMVYNGLGGKIETVTKNGLLSIQCWDEDGNEKECE